MYRPADVDNPPKTSVQLVRRQPATLHRPFARAIGPEVPQQPAALPARARSRCNRYQMRSLGSVAQTWFEHTKSCPKGQRKCNDVLAHILPAIFSNTPGTDEV